MQPHTEKPLNMATNIQSKKLQRNTSLNEIETPDTVNLWNLLKSVEVDPNKDIEKPPTAISIGNAPSFTLGNFSMVIGKAKSKKTFLLTAVAAAVASNGCTLETIYGSLPVNKRKVFYFDTEQSEYHLNRTIKRVLKQTEHLKNFRAFGLRKFPPAERLRLIEGAIYDTKELGIIFIDGIRDLLSRGINDEEEATTLTSKFLRWTSELNIHIVTVLHQNKTDTNARGVIGTEMLNKAETTLAVEVDTTDKSISVVTCEMSRDLPFNDFAFTINDAGLPELCTMPETPTKGKKEPDQHSEQVHFNVLDIIFRANLTPKYSELWRGVKNGMAKHGTRIGDNKAKDFVTYYQQNGWVQNDNGQWRYNRAIN